MKKENGNATENQETNDLSVSNKKSGNMQQPTQFAKRPTHVGHVYQQNVPLTSLQQHVKVSGSKSRGD